MPEVDAAADRIAPECRNDETASGERFDLEATLATGRSQAEEGADRSLREVLQAIDAVHSPDFFFNVHIRGTPSTPVSGRALKRRLEAWLQTLNYNQITADWNDEAVDRPEFSLGSMGCVSA